MITKNIFKKCANDAASLSVVKNKIVCPVKIDMLHGCKEKFYKKDSNIITQNALCGSNLSCILEDRNYMQSRDCEFSNELDPELMISNQGLSGRCWLFAVLNVMRHEIIREHQLNHDFELSESYLTFYEKLEKCNKFLTYFLNEKNIKTDDLKTQKILLGGCCDGGNWITCVNLIRKYGIVPKSSYRESVNSYDTDDMNSVLDYKLKEYISKLLEESDMDVRIKMKDEMICEIYEILCKLLGTPPNPTDSITWSYTLRQDFVDLLEREQKRELKKGKFENLQLKNTMVITPLDFYKNIVVNKLDDYLIFCDDPRNDKNLYYESYDCDVIIEGERTGFFNLNINDISKLCIKSILDNTPIQFECDVNHYFHGEEELWDIDCFNYGLVFNSDFNNITKKQMLECLESYPNHAMVLVGVDLDENKNPIKWKVENSWGRSEKTTGYYTMSHKWFEKFVYNVAIHRKYVNRKLYMAYQSRKKSAIKFRENDILC